MVWRLAEISVAEFRSGGKRERPGLLKPAHDYSSFHLHRRRSLHALCGRICRPYHLCDCPEAPSESHERSFHIQVGINTQKYTTTPDARWQQSICCIMGGTNPWRDRQVLNVLLTWLPLQEVDGRQACVPLTSTKVKASGPRRFQFSLLVPLAN